MDLPKLGKSLACIIVSCLVSTVVHAANYKSYCRPHHWYFDLGVGKAYDYAKSTSFFEPPLDAATPASFLQTTSSYSTPFFLAGIGYLWTQYSQWLPSMNMGIQHRYTAPVDVNGRSTTPFISPQTTNYRYRVQQENWLLMAKADIYRWVLMPYIAAGMGVSFNRVSQFFVDAPTNLNKWEGTTKTSSDFSYSIGAGIDYPIRNDLWFTLGYSYDFFGKNQTGPGFFPNDPAVTPNSVLKNANLHSNSFFLSARYLFG